jgi:hypothetical protein
MRLRGRWPVRAAQSAELGPKSMFTRPPPGTRSLSWGGAELATSAWGDHHGIARDCSAIRRVRVACARTDSGSPLESQPPLTL